MVNSYDFLDPMNKTVYLESRYPSNIQEVVGYMDTLNSPQTGAKLKPQPQHDSWYYSNDKIDDGKISFEEKAKAFLKGGTYNLVRGLFCDENGFSIKRTLSSAAIATAIGFAGPIGAIAAGAIGLIAGAGKFAESAQKAKAATSDQQAREAFEGVGEGTAIGALSLLGGLKSVKIIKNNFSFAKHNKTLNVKFADKFTKWDASKHATKKTNT